MRRCAGHDGDMHDDSRDASVGANWQWLSRAAASICSLTRSVLLLLITQLTFIGLALK